MKNVIGIDLGTTNCCVAIVENGRPRVIEDEKGYNILPSYIAMKGSNKFVVGHGAKAQAVSNPQNTLRTVKRLIGRKFNSPEVEEARRRVGFDLVEGTNQDAMIQVGDITLSPVDASSILLKCIKGIAEKYLGREVTEAVICCPAYFTNAQRKATIEAGQKAGLKVLRLLNEPTAAALAYGYRKDMNKKLLIYDLGGGTFDVSVLEVGSNVYEVLATNGDSYLGGEDFDNRVVDYLAANFKTTHRVDLRQDRMALQRLKDAAERAKCELSFVDKTQIMIPHAHGTTNLQADLTRETLEKLVDDLVQRTLAVVNKTLEEANLKVTDIDDVILVGGQTRMPRIQELVKSHFSRLPSKAVHPDEAVAIGAAVQAASLTEDKGDILLLDVTPFALGIDSAGDVFTRIVPKNATIPVSEMRTFTTVMDNQEKVKIVVRQGESKKASENTFLGEFVLTGIRRAPKMEPKIDVTFRVDFNGILNVSAKDRFTGERQSIMIKDYFERATNPNYDAPPQILAEQALAAAQSIASDGAVAELSEPGERSAAGGRSVDRESAKDAPKEKGILGRFMNRFRSSKEGADAEPRKSGAPLPATMEAEAPSAPDPGGTDSEDYFGASSRAPAPSPSARVMREEAARVAPPAPVSTPVSRSDAPAPPGYDNPWEDPLHPGDLDGSPSMPEGMHRTAGEASALNSSPMPPPAWDADPFSNLPESRPFSGQYTDPFSQRSSSMAAAAGAGFDPYAIAEKNSARARDPFDDLPHEGAGPGSTWQGGLDATAPLPPDPFGVVPRESALDPFAVMEKDAGIAPVPSTRKNRFSGVASTSSGFGSGLDPFGVEDPAVALGGGRPDLFGAQEPTAPDNADLLGGVNIDALFAELDNGIPTISTTTSALRGGGRTALESTQTSSPAWQSGPTLSSPLEDPSGLGLGGDPLRRAEVAGAGPGIRGTHMHADSRKGERGSSDALRRDLSAFGDERASMPAGFAAPEPSPPPSSRGISVNTAAVDKAALGDSTAKSEGAKKKPARLKIAYKRIDAFVSEYSENLARGGTFIKTPSPLDLGRECIFELTIPQREQPILLKGTVVWSSKGAVQLEAGQETGMGIRYHFDETNSQRDLEQLLETLRLQM